MKFKGNGAHEVYVERINRVFEFIDANLDSNLSLERVAELAHYSSFHFHRLFRHITGEPLNAYVNRRRIEKAALVLMHRPETSIAELSLKYGFDSNSTFSRTFKKYYGVSPTEFRKQSSGENSKIRRTDSKIGQGEQIFEKYICNINNLKNWMNMNAKIEVREMPKMELAYVTSLGHNGIAAAYDKLIRWATPRGLMEKPDVKMITIYHDSFKVTSPDKVRISACIKLDEEVEAGGEIGLTSIEASRSIVGCFEIGLHEFEQSWTGLFMWMKEQGYKKADGNPFEIYHNNFNEHPEKKCIVDFCIPIQ